MTSSLSPVSPSARSSKLSRALPRVCLITEAAGAGVGRHFLDLAEGLAARGGEVVAIYSRCRCDASFRERLAVIRGVRFVELPLRRAVHPLDAVDLWKLTRCIQREGPFDVVHCHSSKAGALGRVAAAWLKIPSVYTPNAFVTLDPTLSPLKRRLYGAIEKWLARRSAAIIAVSPDEAEHAASLGIDRRKVAIVLNAIEPPHFPKRESVRQRLNLRPDEFCVGFVGRLSSQKAPEVLVKAMAELKNRHIDATAIIVGSGPEEPRVREFIARHGLETRVRLLGDVVATNVMPAFDVFCLPSRYEGLPYVLLEALAAGLPIVARRVGGAAVCVEHGGNGWIIEGEEEQKFADALVGLATNAEQRHRFAARSWGKSAEMSLDRMLDETVAVYEKAASRPIGR